MIEIDVRHEPYEVEDLSMGSLLELVAEHSRDDWKVGRRQLRLAYHVSVLNPPTEESPAAVAGDQAFVANACEDDLAGEGTPDVALFAVEDFAVAARMGRPAALALVADSLDLHHRLPKLWKRVEHLEVPAWKARRVALLTRKLSYAAARWFDAELDETGRCGWPTIEKWLAFAIAKFHPELVKDPQAPVGKDDWGVFVRHPNTGAQEGSAGIGGTSELTAIGDSLDLARFFDVLSAEAAKLKAAGDTDTLDQRRAKALGRLIDDTHGTNGADGQGTLDFSTSADSATDAAGAAGPASSPSGPRRRGLRVMVHVGLSDLFRLRSDTTDDTDLSLAGSDRLGHVLTAQVRDWLARHGSIATVTPVVDLHRDDAVERHDPPEWMDTQVRLRDRSCVFPHCERTSFDCDLDHIEPYRSPDNGGPPGQTSPENLAPLCRRHHRVKTAGRWRYRRLDDGSYEWISRHGRIILVTDFGTMDITEPD